MDTLSCSHQEDASTCKQCEVWFKMFQEGPNLVVIEGLPAYAIKKKLEKPD